MKSTLRATAALSALAAAVLAGAAIAQDAGPQPPPGPPSADQHAAWMHQRQEDRSRALHEALSIRPDQEAAFQTFQAAMAPRPHEHHDRGGPPGGAPDGQALTTPQRLDLAADRMAKREEEFHARADAIKSFYAALSPDQQHAFDGLFAEMGHRQGMEHGQGGPGHGPGPDRQG